MIIKFLRQALQTPTPYSPPIQWFSLISVEFFFVALDACSVLYPRQPGRSRVYRSEDRPFREPFAQCYQGDKNQHIRSKSLLYHPSILRFPINLIPKERKTLYLGNGLWLRKLVHHGMSTQSHDTSRYPSSTSKFIRPKARNMLCVAKCGPLFRWIDVTWVYGSCLEHCLTLMNPRVMQDSSSKIAVTTHTQV